MDQNNLLLPCTISQKILNIRDVNVMLDYDLADLYEVETKRINEQVKRNISRFPPDFMFQLTEVEVENLMSQNATSSWGGRRKPPYAFTEHGVLMLSSVLKSDRAVAVNIQIMRVYIQLREILFTDQQLKERVENLEESVSAQNNRILSIVDYLQQKETVSAPSTRKVGYK
jgi:hypothetical protein